jgi:uncharacterized protein (TIGR02145 family)
LQSQGFIQSGKFPQKDTRIYYERNNLITMKPSIILLFAFLLTMNLHSQNYEITFSGSGASETVEEVKVVYLSRGDTLDISGSDVLKLVRGTTQINSTLTMDNRLLVYPNPVRDESRISFYTSSSGIVNLELFDITGKLLVNSKLEVSPGNQTYSLSGLNMGIYTLRAYSVDGAVSTSLFSIGENKGVPVLKHEFSDFLSNGDEVNHKSSQSIVELDYTDGDWILFKGRSGNYQRIVTIAPMESRTVDFEFLTCTDYDNNHYPAVTIGTQTWMAENLRTAAFNDGTNIAHVDSGILWRFTGQPGYCWVNNDQDTNGHYGRLYNWYVAGGGKNPCPAGWHVPGYEEYMILHHYLIDNGYNVPPNRTDNTENYGFAGKSISHIVLWQQHTRDGAVGNNPLLNNITGLSLIPAGSRRPDGESFSKTNEWCFLWLSTQYKEDLNAAWNVIVRNDYPRHENYGAEKRRGASIRCIKD